MTRNFIPPSLFRTTKMNSQQQSQSAIVPSLFGSTVNLQQQSRNPIYPSLFGNQQTNPQQQLQLETERRSEELAKEDEMKVRKFEDDVLYRAILAAYRIQGF